MNGAEQMRTRDLERLYDYSYWANERLFASLAQLTPAQFIQPVAGSYESIRNTLVHILSAEWGWLDRCGGPARGERLNPENYPTLDSLKAAWLEVERHMRGFLAGLRDDDLARPVEFALAGGPTHAIPLEELMLHAAVHAGHHRGQVALLVRMLGYAPGNFDLVLYSAAKPNSASGVPARP
jgi:uncharacterized damage-inducible protein DinB